MKLTRKEVEHIADLARLDLSEAEIDQYSQQLSDILEYAARLQKLDTTDVAPMSSSLKNKQVLREDHAQQGLSLQELEQNAPQFEKNQYRVPQVLDSENDHA